MAISNEEFEKIKEYVHRRDPNRKISINNVEGYSGEYSILGFTCVLKSVIALINTPKDPKRMAPEKVEVQLALNSLDNDQLHLIIIDIESPSEVLDKAFRCALPKIFTEWDYYDYSLIERLNISPTTLSYVVDYTILQKTRSWTFTHLLEILYFRNDLPQEAREKLWSSLKPSEKRCISRADPNKVSKDHILDALFVQNNLEYNYDQKWIETVIDKHPGQEKEIIEKIQKKRQAYLDELHRKKVVKMSNQMKKLKKKYNIK